MHVTRSKLAGALFASAAVVVLAGAYRAPSELRVCADPYDMPFSNDHEEGFENKIAQVVARDLNARIVNYWWPSRRLRRAPRHTACRRAPDTSSGCR